MKKLLMLVIVLSGVMGCDEPEDCFKTIGVSGEWVWVQSVGGLAGWTLTPEIEGMTKKLVIDDFFYKEYVNDSLVLETEYDLSISEEVLLGTEERTLITFTSGGSQAILIGEEELRLIEQCFDCFEHLYKRN